MESNQGWTARACELRFVDPDSNANKFYRISVLRNDTNGDYRVVYQWGRVGASGQTSFKMYTNEGTAQINAEHRCSQKLRKGYEVTYDWTDVNPNDFLLSAAGVNLYVMQQPVEVSDGVSFEEMETLVQDILAKAVTAENDTVDVMVEAATMNAKFAKLREQFQDAESSVEFVNNAVRARL